MAIGKSIGSTLGGAVGSLYGPLGSAAGSALGAAAGATLEAIPALVKTDAEKENAKRLAQLKRMQEMGTLGLSEAEKQSLYGAGQSQIANQLQQGQQVARQAGAAGMATGAGQEQLRAAQAAEANANLAAGVARNVEAQNLERKRQLEEEEQSRIAAKAQYEQQRLQAGLSIATAGLAGGMERYGLEQTIQGKKPSTLEIQSMSRMYGIPEDQAEGFLSFFSQRPEMVQYMSLIGKPAGLGEKAAPMASGAGGTGSPSTATVPGGK
jgi:hypothetical protein